MSAYQQFTANRATSADLASLLALLRAGDDTIRAHHASGTQSYTLKKATAWSAGQISAAQNILDTAPASSPTLTAQAIVDAYPLEIRALILALLDQINVIRGLLLPPLGAITPAQALAAIRTKAGTL